MSEPHESSWERPEIRDLDISDCKNTAVQPTKCFETNPAAKKPFASQVPQCKKKKKKPKPS